MTRRIVEDHARFRAVISGRYRKALKHLIGTGAIVRHRPKGGKLTITIPQINIPHFVHGDTGEGVGRGPGKRGTVVGRDPQQGKGKGKGAGGDAGEGIRITVDLDDVLKFMEDELKLPPMKPKPNQTFEEIRHKYTNISKTGLNSLRHVRRTLRETIRRMAMTGELAEQVIPAGMKVPVRMIAPIKADFRYRQFREIRVPASNAVVFFARDCSASMDDYRCDIVSDMCWWIDCWVRRFYKRVERCYIVHDTQAEEVDEEKFYSYRFAGGTQCSSAFEAVAEKLENRFPPEQFNVYVFYFTDGDNMEGDNEKVVSLIQEKLGPNVANMVGVAQVCAYSYTGSLKEQLDAHNKDDGFAKDHVRTASIMPDGPGSDGSLMDPAQRDRKILDAIRKLLSTKQEYREATSNY